MTLMKLQGRSLRTKLLVFTPLLTLGLVLGLVHSPDSCAGTLKPQFTVYGAQVAKQIQTETAIARQVGRPDNIDELIRRLLVTIRALSHYDVDVEMPVVRSLSLTEIHRRLCAGPCTIRAAYVPGDGLYIDEAMDPLTNRYEQSILFHELVHHVQDVTISHGEYDECRRWREREIEAYALQNQFLYSLGLASRVMYPGKFCAPTHEQAAIEDLVSRD
jgi:hypothetical protein